MRQIRIGLANIDTTVGAFDSNIGKAIEFARQMAAEGCHIGCFQEQTITGYPCEDLIQWPGFVEGQLARLGEFTHATRECAQTVFTIGVTIPNNGHLYNAVAVVHNGKIWGIVPKEKLPTYGVFYEQRTFSPGGSKPTNWREIPFGDFIFEIDGNVVMAVEVCEDIWSSDGPMRRRSYSGAELVINASASPWRTGVLDTRREMISTRAADNQTTVVYVNQYGGQDSLVFDGGGFVNQNGRSVFQSPRWQEGVATQVIDLDATTRMRQENTTWRDDCTRFHETNQPVKKIQVSTLRGGFPVASSYRESDHSYFLPRAEEFVDSLDFYFEELLQAMKTGLAGYFEKTGAFERVGFALSGGKDSVLSLIVAWQYANDKFAHLSDEAKDEKIADFIHCFSMPTSFNSDDTKNISATICRELGVTFSELSIQEAFKSEVEAAQTMLGPDKELTSLTLQNIQARIRGQRMWNWSNSASALWIQTGNMSERAVGYTTVGGDNMGGYSLIANLPKTVIIALLEYIEKVYGWKGVELLNQTKASAELAEDQEDEKDLMPFEVLDACFYLFAGEKMMPKEVYITLRNKFSAEDLKRMRLDYQPEMLKEWVKRFVRLFVSSIFKWVQAPQSVHLGKLDLDRERALQLPVVQSREWLDLDNL